MIEVGIIGAALGAAIMLGIVILVNHGDWPCDDGDD